MLPTADASLILRPDGPHAGRILFCNVHDSYNGDIITYSDDSGQTYRFSGQLHRPGLDECALAQLRNGSVLFITRRWRNHRQFDSYAHPWHYMDYV
jgi:hypothetical protein